MRVVSCLGAGALEAIVPGPQSVLIIKGDRAQLTVITQSGQVQVEGFLEEGADTLILKEGHG